MGSVKAICISPAKGTVKRAIDRCRFRPEHGIEGDAHAGNWHRQVSLLAHESIERMRQIYPAIDDGAFAENVVVEGMDLRSLAVGDHLWLGESVELEVTQIGKECHHGCVIRQKTGDCIMPREGIFCRVLEGGDVSCGDRARCSRKSAIA